MFFFFASFQSGSAVDVGVQVLPGAPINAAGVYTSQTQIQLTWDPSVSPPSDIESYTIFYKESSAPAYPPTPQITVTDSLVSYSQLITVTAGLAYDFIIFANSHTGLTSTADCDSCFVLNLVSCGDGVIIAGEDCDGTALGTAVCTDFGYGSGTISCSSTCQYDFNLCNQIVSGGGGTTTTDTIAPIPGTAVSPQYANTSPFPVTYSGALDSGGSGLNYVALFYKKGTGSWLNSGLVSSGSAGSFDFVPDSSLNAIYYFDLQAWDNEGNSSPTPGGNGDDNTIYDIQAPTIGTITIPGPTKTLPIVISYVNAVDVGTAGLDHVELWYKKGSSGGWTDSGMTRTNASDSFNFELANESANYYFDLIAVDRAGNRSTETDETTKAVAYDIDPPSLAAISLLATTTTTPIVVGYTGAADIGPAGLKHLELWYKKGADGAWVDSTLRTTSADGSFNYIPSSSTGTYYFTIILEDNMGNRTAPASGDGLGSVIYTAEPFAAVLSTLPPSSTELTTASITVGGANITAYKSKLDTGNYGAETPVATKIDLAALSVGIHTLSVIGKNNLNQWQDQSSPTTYSWTVTAPVPPPVEEVTAEEGEPDTEEPVVEEPVVEEPVTETPTTETPTTETPTTETPAVEEPTTEAPTTETPTTGTPTTGTGGDTSTEEPVTEEPVTEEPVVETPVTEEPVPVIKEVPEITPPAPEVHYSAEEIQEKSIETIRSKPVIQETPTTVVLPEEEKVLTRIDECRLEFPTLPFGERGTDSDDDGLSNKTECYAFTNPLLKDTDSDGCSDGDEINQYSSDPLNPLDCTVEEKKKIISISSPQAGWLLAELEVAGLTPDDTSLVNLLVFPVDEDGDVAEEATNLGTINRFNPSSIEGQYHFKMKPETTLPDGASYDLVAIGVLLNGETITSNPIRFSLDSKSTAVTPVPTSIGNIPIVPGMALENIQVEPTEGGKVEITGKTEYGAQVFAVWESIVLASSVIADSTLGEFAIESPRAMTFDEKHEVTLFAVKTADGQKLRSKSVGIGFYIISKSNAGRTTILTLTLLSLVVCLLYNFWRVRMKKRLKKKK